MNRETQFGSWRRFIGMVVCAVLISGQTVSIALAQERFKEPLHRVAKAKFEGRPGVKQHPIDPAISLAQSCLIDFRKNVKDYQSVVVKRERIDGTLGNYEYMLLKIRNERSQNGRLVQPFGVYGYFLKPDDVKGREILYVKGANKDKMLAHEGTNNLLNKIGSIWLKPDGPIAMKGQRYPVYEIGIENLIVKLLERAGRDRTRGECNVEFRKGAVVNGSRCTMVQVTHPVRRAFFDFHIAQIYIDDQHNMPIRYAAYGWPTKEGGRPPVIEEYTYINVKLNPGFTDRDFDHKNPAYGF